MYETPLYQETAAEPYQLSKVGGIIIFRLKNQEFEWLDDVVSASGYKGGLIISSGRALLTRIR